MITVVIVCATIMTSIVSIMAATNGCSHNDVRYKQISGPEEMHEVWCNDCNKFIVAELHTFHAETDALSHWQECEDCEYSKEFGFHIYGSNMSITVDTHTRICSVCDYSKVDDHAISSWTITSASHRGTCSVCNYTVFESHSFKNGACSKCGVSESTINNMIEQGIEQMTITLPTVTE